MKQQHRVFFAALVVAAFFHIGPVMAQTSANDQFRFGSVQAANKPLNVAKPASNPTWYNDASSFFQKPNEQNTQPVAKPVAIATDPMLDRIGSVSAMSMNRVAPAKPMLARDSFAAMPIQPPRNDMPAPALNPAPVTLPSLALEAPQPVVAPLPNNDWAQSFAEITPPVTPVGNDRFPNLASVPMATPPVESAAAIKTELQQQNAQAQQIIQQNWQPEPPANMPLPAAAGNATPTPVANQNWPMTPVYVGENAATASPPTAATPNFNQPMPSLPMVMAPQSANVTPNMPMNPSAITGSAWPPVTAEAPPVMPLIMNPGPVLVQPLTPPVALPWQQQQPAAIDLAQPMPSLGAMPTMAASEPMAMNPMVAPMPNMAAVEPPMPQTLPGDRLRTPGQSAVALDPVGPAMMQYTNRMQESAPATTGAPYYPYGYSGLGYWYNNPQWATYQRNQNLAAQQAGLPARRVPQFNKPIATIYFRDDSAALDAQSRKVLAQLADWYKNQGGGLKIAGHASARTADMNPTRQAMGNYRLSLERADAVTRELKRLGVVGDKIQLRAFGDNQQAFNESMPVGESWNRRVEIYWDMF